MAFTPEVVEKYLAEDEMKLYRLIWNRFVACQMMPAVFDQTTIDVSAPRARTASTTRSAPPGRCRSSTASSRSTRKARTRPTKKTKRLKHKLPAGDRGRAVCSLKALRPEQHFTEPPPRYNEATLVKRLEADGVGRPSTYASILSTIQEREYVKKEGGRFIPTELGMVVTDLLLESFDDIFDVKYTARMEEELDEIEEGKLDWRAAMARVLRALRPRPEARRRAHDRHQADGEAHRLDVREVRQAAGDQVGQARQLHGVHRVSRFFAEDHRRRPREAPEGNRQAARSGRARRSKSGWRRSGRGIPGTR